MKATGGGQGRCLELQEIFHCAVLGSMLHGIIQERDGGRGALWGSSLNSVCLRGAHSPSIVLLDSEKSSRQLL